jgi:hypothetical protein
VSGNTKIIILEEKKIQNAIVHLIVGHLKYVDLKLIDF